ncbi:MAG: PDZ domain-containing protein [Moorea sp. SIOASIH]|uniref:PDZ domain-containing protein n=1 Tax=Moorena sp. SIOASIH TaxID=2607817 RepID=UPI0013B610CA|nr:PDZ domain-containing protein [Moorena sp. SIOASIH]NEO37664.1 PDZ domain-containing protein [Moorena sp. SIOASIH]
MMPMGRYLWLLMIAVSMPASFVGLQRLVDITYESSATIQPLSYQIPFDYYGDHIYLPISVNGSQPRWFILDSGAADTFISQDYAQSLGLQPQGRLDIVGIGPVRLNATFARGVTFNLTGIQWSDAQVVIAPEEFFLPLARYFGQDFSGVIGYEFFEQFVVEIDYDNQIIHLHDPKTYRYSGSGERMPLKLVNQKPYLKTTLMLAPGLSVNSHLLIDLGSGSALDLRGKLIDENPEIASAENTLASFTLGVGGEEKIHVGRLESLQLGKLTIDHPITAFSLGKGNQRSALSGRIGNDILRRFNVILDYTHKQMILEPNARFSEPYEYDMSGLWLGAEGQEYDIFRIDKVFQNSPAARAGLQVGDLITHVDSQPVTELTLEQVRQLLMNQGGQIRLLSIQRGDDSLQFHIKLERLI